MKPATRFVLLAVLAGIGAGLSAWRAHARTEERRTAVEKEVAVAKTMLSRVERERSRAAQALAFAQAAAATSVAAADTPAASDPVATWHQNVATLRALLVRRPEWAIPEIELLKPEEFLYLVREAKVDTDAGQREALRDLHAMGRERVDQNLHYAHEAYAKANAGRLPSDLRDLKPFLKPPLPDAVLDRYVRAGPDNLAEAKDTDVVFYERAPVDELYDTRLIHMFGGRSMQMITDPAMYVLARALTAHAAAHPGRTPASAEELAPYLEVPLEAATLTRYFAGWQKEPATFGLTRYPYTHSARRSAIGQPPSIGQRPPLPARGGRTP